MIYRRAQSMLKLPANCYSYCFLTVDGPSAILFIPDSHCFILPGPYSLDSRDCIFEWVYSVLIAFLSIFSISPLSFHLEASSFFKYCRPEGDGGFQRSALTAVYCYITYITYITFPTRFQHAAVWRQLMCPTRRCSRRLRGMDFRSTGTDRYWWVHMGPECWWGHE